MALILTMMLGLAGGYVAVVLCYFLVTLAITAVSPHFVSSRGRFRTTYLILNCLVWALCAMVGGYLATMLSVTQYPWLPVGVLAISLSVVTWLYPLEAQKQLGGLSRVLMSGLSLAGVALGYYVQAGHWGSFS